jgi:uncharacterized protein
MSLDQIDYVYTFGMDEADLDEALEGSDVGVLALASDGAAYAVPVSYSYEAGSLYFRLTTDGASKKLASIDQTTEACFLLYAVDPQKDSWSIVATGPIHECDDDARETFDEATVNERFTELRIFDEAIEAVEWRLYELRIEELTGRKTGTAALT